MSFFQAHLKRTVAFCAFALLLTTNPPSANPDTQQPDPPLVAAMRKHDVAKARYLLAHGTQADSRTARSITALDYAVHDNDFPMVKLLVAHGADVNAPTYDGYTPLMYAAASGVTGTGVVTFLLSHGAQVTATAQDKSTALHLAAKIQGRSDVVALLLQRGAAVDAMDVNYDRPLTLAAKYKKGEIVKTLLAHGADGAYALVWESYGNDVNGVRILLDAGVSPDARFTGHSGAYYGSTALIEAARQENLEIAQLLLDRGADPNLVEPGNGNMTTALMWAAYNCNSSMISLLSHHGVWLNTRNSDGNTAYALAQSGWTKTMQPCDSNVLSALEVQ